MNGNLSKQIAELKVILKEVHVLSTDVKVKQYPSSVFLVPSFVISFHLFSMSIHYLGMWPLPANDRKNLLTRNNRRKRNISQ